jgi:CheY-like chemotaxis protein
MNARTKPRVLTQKEVTINGSIHAHCFDINEEGMYIQTETVFTSKDVIDLNFEVDGKIISVKASVRHLEPDFGIGVKFINLGPEDKAALGKFITIKSSAESGLKLVMIVDSSEQQRAVYKYRLQQDGCGVIEAANGTDAFKILQLTQPDIVVLDNQSEGINAFKLLQFMKTKAELKDIPAIILTSRFIPEELNQAMSLGIKDYLVKATTSPNKLSEKVLKLLNKE